MDPIPEFRLRFEQVEDGKVLIILDIFKGEETPYYYSGDGVLEAYVRVGNESVKATSTELKRQVLRGRNTSYDSQISTYKVEDFAFSKLRERYKKWTGNSFDEKDLISFGLANEQGYLTNAGALVADESPIRWSRLFCTRWNGLNKSGGTIDAFDDAEYSGSVLSLIDNGEAFIKRNAKLMWRKTANSREETRFWQIYLIGWDIWNVKVVDSEKSSAAMNFRSTMMKVKSRLLDQIDTSLQL